ncbi:hypothetical protein TSAR_006583 [Trichomalopsis sarcophagae]|uniref:DUF1736 domain-containing protein n=1 Tax=Trichomalopsis sarcophagae TaxID=543379 RepID=A0A232FF26_9HYME|nr:hypothetical protein TSAR_006583 [Trichomalopsis sarcophagae]
MKMKGLNAGHRGSFTAIVEGEVGTMRESARMCSQRPARRGCFKLRAVAGYCAERLRPGGAAASLFGALAAPNRSSCYSDCKSSAYYHILRYHYTCRSSSYTKSLSVYPRNHHVTGIVGRADVLACIFFLLSFLAYHGQPTAYVWSSVGFGALSMLAKETGVTVLLLNLLYDLCRTGHSIKRSVFEAKWNDESRLFTRRAAVLLVSMGVLLVVRLALLHGALPKFSPQDNPAAFHPCFHVRLLTFCYLAALNCWLVLCPATLSHDWQMGSVPLIASLADTRNLATCLFFGGCLVLTYRAFTDFEYTFNNSRNI